MLERSRQGIAKSQALRHARQAARRPDGTVAKHEEIVDVAFGEIVDSTNKDSRETRQESACTRAGPHAAEGVRSTEANEASLFA